MTYTKPEVNLLGDAAEVIQFVGKTGEALDSAIPSANPAYDLDE